MADLYNEAMERFQNWYDVASGQDVSEPAAMTLATVNEDGRPSARTVLLKQIDAQGFVFYTNVRSRKGQHLGVTPYAALVFFWQPLMQQVLVEGSVTRVDDDVADAYWATRSRLSQTGAWASQQSERLQSRAVFEHSFKQYAKRYAHESVPRPSHWTGFRIRPDMIEFWQSRPGRMHERERYWREQGGWRKSLIYP